MADIAEIVVNKLIKLNATVSTAESCTGGLIAGTIVNVSGASSCFNEGYVTYSNAAKAKNLGVKKETLEKFGAVSEETAREMAAGVKDKAEATFGVASTGIAGPTGGTKEKPVGLIYISCAYKDKICVKELHLKGNRLENRLETVEQAMSLLNDCIDKFEENN